MEGLARFLTEHLGTEQPVRYRFDEESQRIFLYHALEEAVWNHLARNSDIQSSTPNQIQAEINRFLSENPNAGWIPIAEAALNYGFVPCGFEKVEVYSSDQKFLGYTVITAGGGMAHPEVISSDGDWIGFIKHLLGNEASKPNLSATINSPFGYISIPHSSGCPSVRWIKVEDSKLLPGSGIVRYRKPAEFARNSKADLPRWADSFFLELEPLTHWDEGEPEPMSLIRNSRSELISAFGPQLDRIQAAYTSHDSPLALCKEWLELSHQLSQLKHVDLAQLVARALSVPTLPGSSTMLDELFAVTEVWGQEGLSNEYQKTSTSEGFKRLEEREKQMREGRARYPELSLFGDQSLTYWWRRYIQDTENETADVAFDPAYSVLGREADPDFIFYMVLRSTENHGPLEYVFLRAKTDMKLNALKDLGLQSDAKSRVKGAVLMLAYLTEETDYEEIPEIINDWRLHVTRLLDVAIASANIGGLALQHSRTGPRLFSERDRMYCQQRGIIMSYRLPRK